MFNRVYLTVEVDYLSFQLNVAIVTPFDDAYIYDKHAYIVIRSLLYLLQ